MVLQGYHSGSLIVALLGIFKAVVGLLIRPAVGTMELLGKSAHGVGLLFLGREGISGTIQKRARAPGTLTDDSDEVSFVSPQAASGTSMGAIQNLSQPQAAAAWNPV